MPSQNLSETQKKRLFYVGFPTLCFLSLLLIAMTFIPATHELVRNLIISQSRQVLAKAEADLPQGGGKIAVIKVKTADTLAIEIFESDSEGKNLNFVKRMVLPEIRDAYFNFHDQATNLAIGDIDNDGHLEILAPTYDENLVPRLNVYKYDANLKNLERLGPENFNL
jgi:hypothetical protein